MPLRPSTSERVCGSQPPARSPLTALQNGGLGVEAHDLICADTPSETSEAATSAMAASGHGDLHAHPRTATFAAPATLMNPTFIELLLGESSCKRGSSWRRSAEQQRLPSIVQCDAALFRFSASRFSIRSNYSRARSIL